MARSANEETYRSRRKGWDRASSHGRRGRTADDNGSILSSRGGSLANKRSANSGAVDGLVYEVIWLAI